MKTMYEYQERNKKGYVTTFTCEDSERVYQDLTHELISKKLCSCTYIKSIKREQLYNGFIRITVTYDNGGRRIYTIADH